MQGRAPGWPLRALRQLPRQPQRAPPHAWPLSNRSTDPQAIQRPTMRSILPNPFAGRDKTAKPPAPSEGPASRPAGTGAVEGQLEQGPRPPAQEQAHGVSPPVNKRASRDERFTLQRPLPSREESERQIREEAAKKKADMLAQFESKQANQRTQWIADQIKFREELSEAVRSLGNKAGPDIDKLAKRYGTEVDPVR